MLEVVHLVLQLGLDPQAKPCEPDWADVLHTVSSDKFLRTLQCFDISCLQGNCEFAQYLCQHYLAPQENGPEALTFERVRHASRAVLALFSWSARVVEKANLDVPPSGPQKHRSKSEQKQETVALF